MNIRSLSTQIVLSFVALVLLTVTAVGGPAIWLIREQMDRQAWSQMEQGKRVSEALYTARQSELANLATLTGQRPTLQNLVTQGKEEALSNYLETLRAGAALDLMIVCGPDRQEMARAGSEIATDVCRSGRLDGFHAMPEGTTPRVWLFAAQPIGSQAAHLGDVITGIAVDDGFAVEISAQSGLEHTVLMEGQPVATSFAPEEIKHRLLRAMPPEEANRGTLSINGHPYYVTRLSLSTPDLEDEIALDVADIAATQRYLIGILVGSIAVVATLGSVLGVILARRIGHPLARLTEAAAQMSEGNLDAPATVETEVHEIALVAQALERARVDLQRTLTHLREEKAWTDHLLEAIVEGIVTLDQDDCITFFSHGAERITGWPRDQVLGRPCDDVFRPVDSDEPFSQLIPAPGRRHKIVTQLADGEQATLAVTGARLVPPDGAAEVALVFRDVSEEEAMHRLLGHFLANIAHEFRTPLSALAASIELLLDRTSELSQAELRELLNSLHLGILGLQTLVDNLLESASIEAGWFRVYPRPSDLGEIIAEATHTMQPLLDRRDQRFVIELPADIPVVRADPNRAAQVLVNLLSNASKYGPEHAEIIISAVRVEGRARISVADRGPGIPPAHRETLFRRFAPPPSGDKRTWYGAGLGLSVVKAIVEAHNGQVGVDDRPGGGSIFWFTLPLVDEE